MTRKLSVVAGVILLAAIAWAVAAGARPDHAPLPDPATLNTATLNTATLNTAALDLATTSTAYQQRAYVLSLAEQQLITRCMAGQGWTYWPAEPAPVTDPIDLPYRRTHGYGLNDPSVTPPPAGPRDDDPGFEKALSGSAPAYRQITLPNGSTLGYPTTGCLAQARASLYGDDTTWARADSVTQILSNTVLTQAGRDPILTKTIERWAGCMKAAGFTYQSPGAALSALTAVHPRAREIAVATADGKCQLQVGLPAADQAARRATAAALPVAQRRELLDLARAHCHAYRRAAQVTGRSGPQC
jgi:hypothetical protein